MKFRLSQGFRYFARSWTRKIQVFPRNPTKFPKKREIPRNPPEIFPNTCRQNILILILAIRPVLFPPNVQIFLETSSLQRVNNVPKLLGVLRFQYNTIQILLSTPHGGFSETSINSTGNQKKKEKKRQVSQIDYQ